MKTAAGTQTFTFSDKPWRSLTPLLSAIIVLLGLSFANAANQTYTNAPVDNTWTNINNWVARAVPGQVNNVANNGIDNSIATFNTPIPLSGIGGAGNPIITDDGTVSGGTFGGAKARMLGGFIFDTVNCGAYVFYVQSTPYIPGVTGGNPESGALLLCNGNSITINAAVTNSQKFMGPVEIRLPSSTTGTYNFVNNATSPSATLFMTNVFLYSGATGRGVTFALGGSNTGTNSIYHLAESPTATAAVSGITKQGAGNWYLTGPNTFRVGCPMAVNEGTLFVQDPAGLGLVTTVTVNSNGVLEVDGVTLAGPASVNLQGHGTFRNNGSGLITGTTVGTAVGISVTLATVNPGDILTNGTAVLKVTGGGADSVLHSAGPGLIIESFSNNYAGRWSIDGGTNRITDPGALGLGQNLNIGAGAVLDISPLGAVPWLVTTLGIGGTGTGTSSSTAATILADAGAVVNASGKAIGLTFSPTGTSGDTTHPSLYMPQGTLSLGNNIFTIVNTGAPLGLGTYRLIQTGGTVIDGGGYVALVNGNGVAFGTLGQIQVSGGNVNLVVGPYTAKDLTWQGGHPDSVWNTGSNTNWLTNNVNSIFNVSDRVVFNAVGATNPIVSLSGTIVPGALLVDTTSTNYTFNGPGSLAGPTGLTKIGTNTLALNTVNTYLGSTIVSNGTVKVGIANALPNTGSGTVAVYNPGVLDLNSFSNSIGALSGDGTVDNRGLTAATITLGANDTSGSFSGTITNSTSALNVYKLGLGVQTLTSANTYTGATVIASGTLRIANINALGLGLSPVTLNAGTLDMASNLKVATLTGADGAIIANNATSSTNTLTVLTNSTIISAIVDGSGGGGIAVFVPSLTSLTLSGPNSYSGGTIVADHATLAIGVRNGVGSGSAGAGGITASNGVTINMPTAVTTSVQVPNSITTVDGASVTFTSGGASSAVANSFNGQFIGSALATNIIAGNMSIGGGDTFSNFLGLVIMTNINSGNALRWNGTDCGGANTMFDFENGNMQTRDATLVRMGGLKGSRGGIFGPSVTAGATYMIGGLGVDTIYSGTISGSNNIVKIGTGRLTFNGTTNNANIVVNDDGSSTTNYTAANGITYTGATTVSNGVLAIVAPANLSSGNVTVFTLAGTNAVLDVSKSGFTPDGITFVTNGILTVFANGTPTPSSSFGGIGTLNGSLVISNGSTMSVGLPVGTLTVTTNVELGGVVKMDVVAGGTPNCSKLVSPTITVDATASLIVTNGGPEAAATFQLFNHPVSFLSVTLPTLSGTNSWVNNLAVDGSITLIAPALVTVSTNVVPIVFASSGGVLALSWPSDHIGWRLQSQTNSLNVGITTNWFDVAGSSTTNQINAIITPGNPTVFYRLIYP